MKKPNKETLSALEQVIARLERWQIKHGQHDPAALAMHAKNQLFRLLRELEAARGE